MVGQVNERTQRPGFVLRQRWRADPFVRYFETPVIVDNAAGVIEQD